MTAYARRRADWQNFISGGTPVDQADLDAWDQAILELKNLTYNDTVGGASGDGTGKVTLPYPVVPAAPSVGIAEVGYHYQRRNASPATQIGGIYSDKVQLGFVASDKIPAGYSAPNVPTASLVGHVEYAGAATVDAVAVLGHANAGGYAGNAVWGANFIARNDTGATLSKLVGVEIDVEPVAGTTVSASTVGLALNVFNLATHGTGIQIGGVSGGTFDNGIIIDGSAISAILVEQSGALRLQIAADGSLVWGASLDTNLRRGAADRLQTDDLFDATGLGLATKVTAGAPVDGNWAVAPPNGTIVVDSTNNKLWARIGGVWKGVVVA